MDSNKPLNATDEVAAAEAELKAAQERLEAARAKLAAAESSALETEVTERVSLGSEVDAKFDASADAGADTGPAADEDADTTEAVEAFEVVEVVEVVAAPADADADSVSEGTVVSEGATAPVEADDAQASGEQAAQPASCTAGQEGEPEWVPYSTPQTPPPPPLYGNPAQQTSSNQAAYPTHQQPPATPFGTASGSGYQPPAGYVAPGYGQPPHVGPHVGPNAVPPQQPPYGYQQPYNQEQYAQPVVGTKDHVAAGLLAIFLGWLGIHKFYMGYNTAGFIMLAVSIVGGIFTVTLATWVIWVIAVIEGILYLTKSQTEFEQIYVLNKKEWF